MTAANFLNELRAIQSAYQWFVTKDGRIRATAGADTNKRVFDPITAVVFAHTGQFFPEGTWAKAAVAIDMTLEDCADFVSAFNFDWHASTRQGGIRHDLLEAVMIATERAPDQEVTALPLFTHRKRSPGRTTI